MGTLRAYVELVDRPTGNDNRTDTHIVAVVTDDVRKLEVDWIGSSMADLKAHLRPVLDKVTPDAALAALKVNDIIDLSVPAQPATPAFFTAWALLQSELAKVDAGILDPADKRVTNARAAALAVDDATMIVGRR